MNISPGLIKFEVNSDNSTAEALSITSDGQVVINRSSGAVLGESYSKLEVFNATENLIFVANSTAAANQDAGIIFAPANNVYGGKIIVTSDEDFSTSANRSAHMAFYTRKDGTADERLRISSNGDVTTTGANYSRANAGFTARKGDSVNITRASGTPLEINRTGNNGTIINLFKDQSIIGSVGVDGGDVWIGANGSAYDESVRIDSGGRVLINRTNNDAPGGSNSKLQVRDTSYTASISIVRNDPGAGGPYLIFGKSRNATQSDNSLVQVGDTLGQISFYGADGTDMNSTGAVILAQVDGSPNTNDMPGRLVFKTTPDNGSSSNERLRITSGGTITVPLGPTNFPDGTTAAALVNTSGRQPTGNNDFQTANTNNLASGWYTIAVSNGGRATGRIGIRDQAGSRHQAITFYAGHHYGGAREQNGINVIFSSGRHSGNPLGALRIKANNTYDGAMLQVYLRDSYNYCQAFLLGDNFQSHGWIMKNWVPDGTNPGDLVDWNSIQNGGVPAYADLNQIREGGASFETTIPGFDNAFDLGSASLKWRDVYCNQGAFNNSDEVLKQDIHELTTAEMNAAKRISKLFRTYKWKESVVEKGDDARIHTGAIAQQIQAAMSAEGLDAANYGFFGKDEWYEHADGTKLSLDAPTRENDTVGLSTNTTLGGNIVVPTGFNKITRYSVRYTELLAFVAAYNEQRFTSIETRLTTLESS